VSDAAPIVVGLISDTHGMVRPGVHTALAGVELLLHAGDVGGDEILDELSLIAPVYAVFGNTDSSRQARLQQNILREIAGLRVRVTHGHELGSPTPEALLERYAEDVLIYGHTHRALVTHADGRLVVNPGAAGPGRFDIKPSVARMTIADGRAEVEIVWL
jgi:putative phosphoesterase